MLVVTVQRMFHCLTEDGHVRPKISNNQPFRESALDELEKREGAGTLFAQSIITRCSSTSCWPEKTFFWKLQQKKVRISRKWNSTKCQSSSVFGPTLKLEGLPGFTEIVFGLDDHVPSIQVFGQGLHNYHQLQRCCIFQEKRNEYIDILSRDQLIVVQVELKSS